MSVLKEVTVSGAVGKQVFTSAQPVVFLGGCLTAVSAATVTIRDGYASGEIAYKAIGIKGTTFGCKLKGARFDKGMHVKVIGTNSAVYLEIE